MIDGPFSLIGLPPGFRATELEKRTYSRVKELLDRARRTNDERDVIDHQAGVAAPIDCPFDAALRTVMVAIQTGISMEDWDCVAEGLVMLQDIEWKLRRLMKEQTNGR